MRKYILILGLVFGCASEEASGPKTQSEPETVSENNGQGVLADTRARDFLLVVDGIEYQLLPGQMTVWLYEDKPPKFLFGFEVDKDADGDLFSLGVQDDSLRLFETGRASYTDLKRQTYLSYKNQQVTEGMVSIELQNGKGEHPYEIRGAGHGTPVSFRFEGPIHHLACNVPAHEVPGLDPATSQPYVWDKEFKSEGCKALQTVGE